MSGYFKFGIKINNQRYQLNFAIKVYQYGMNVIDELMKLYNLDYFDYYNIDNGPEMILIAIRLAMVAFQSAPIFAG